MEREYIIHLLAPGPRPPFYLVADHLWGAGSDVDSDGDSGAPDDTDWTELSLSLRGASESEQVHIDPVSDRPLILAVRSPSAAICERVGNYLQSTSGGSIEKIA